MSYTEDELFDLVCAYRDFVNELLTESGEVWTCGGGAGKMYWEAIDKFNVVRRLDHTQERRRGGNRKIDRRAERG